MCAREAYTLGWLPESVARDGRVFMIGAGYHTHYPFLAAALASRPYGPVLELGAGDWSTVMLHYMCEAQKRLLVTAESDRQWLDRFMFLASPWHLLHYVPIEGWGRYPVTPPGSPSQEDDPAAAFSIRASRDRWDIVLVDCYPAAARGPLIGRLRAHVDLFVAHDSETLEANGYEPLLSSFKHRADFRLVTPWTTIVSDLAPIW
jgi:hypothetical protein